MFGYSTGRSAYPTVYSVRKTKKSTKTTTPTPSVKSKAPSTPESIHSLGPSIDGPPSPERIRAYTEQMKRGSLFGGHSRSNTFSSATPSFLSHESASRDSTSPSMDDLSRKSSHRSNSSSMPSTRSSRPESIQILGSLFSRSGRRGRKDSNANSSSSPPRSPEMRVSSIGSIGEEGSAKDHYYGRRGSRRRHNISGPYNFQHVTHTQQDHLPNLDQASRLELASEFSALRASQVPTSGELKGIRADDLHFENFSSEALSTAPKDSPPVSPKTTRSRAVLRKVVAPPQLQRSMSYTKSHNDLRVPPPRPPRSPLTPICPDFLPARTSSRTASVLYETFDPLATTSLERPYTQGGFRRPTPFNPPVPPPLPSWDEQQQLFNSRPISHAVSTPGDEAWPLPAALVGNFGGELADVQEEDEEMVSKGSRISTSSIDLRQVKSVPGLRQKSIVQSKERPESRLSTTLGSPSSKNFPVERAPLSAGFQSVNDSWESDIDWCYEHEVEANCNFQWDHDSGAESATTPQPSPQPALELQLQDEERVYTGRFRPSLLVPSPYEMPDLSPVSNSTISSDPRTPLGFLRPRHERSPSHASSFKESHGFDLSPTLLIPNDFQSQMEQEALYDEHFANHPSRGSIFLQEPFNHSISPVEEAGSSTASYRSSNFSRGSARSSSSTRMSGNSRASQDSMILLERASGMSDFHRSRESTSSVPDLVPSPQKVDADLLCGISGMSLSNESADSAPAPEVRGPTSSLSSVQHRRNRSLVLEQGLRKTATPQKPAQEAAEYNWALSPVAEFCPKFEVPQVENAASHLHGRKVSAPLLSQQLPPAAAPVKGRPRASTSVGPSINNPKKGKGGGYMLFPQTSLV